jgi:hypothetical protein
MQINNLKIKEYKHPFLDTVFQVISPDGRTLEQFFWKIDAERWARSTRDFVSERTRKRLEKEDAAS